MKPDKLPGVILSPRWQNHVTQDLSVLLGAIFKLVLVREEFWEIEELWDEFLDIRHVGSSG